MVEDVKSGARVWDYIAVIYDKPHLNGGIDMKAIFAALAGKNLISSSDYISGYHLGAELTGGKGEIRVNSVDTDFQVGTKPPAGGTGGTSGNDTIESLPGADTFDGGAGNDTLSFRNSTAAVTADLQTGKASGGYGTGDTFKNFENLTGSNYGDTLFGNADANIISGEGGNDIIDGRGGDDKIYGGAGHDKLSGGAGADVIFGGDGWDRITGGAGRDTMTGGTGGDYFVFNTGDSIPSAPDVILDFSFAEGDRIDLAGVDGNSLISGYQRFTFIGSGDFTKAGQLRVDFHGGDAFIYGDTNGDKKPDFALQLDNVTSLKADAFLF
jgi:Ca2+-binding RTX toxin-like protein